MLDIIAIEKTLARDWQKMIPSLVMLMETIIKQLCVVAIAFVEFIQKQVKWILFPTLSKYQKNYNSYNLWCSVRDTSTGIAITSPSLYLLHKLSHSLHSHISLLNIFDEVNSSDSKSLCIICHIPHILGCYWCLHECC